MQFFKKAEPINELDLAQQRKDLSTDTTERRRLQPAVEATTAGHERAHADLSSIINDATRFALTPEAELQAAKAALVSAAQAKAQAKVALTAHETATGDLVARGKQLRQEEHFLEQQAGKSADREDAAEIVRLGSALAAVLARREQRLQAAVLRWPAAESLSDGREIEKFGGLTDISFPAGIFHTEAPAFHGGENVGQRTIWSDHVLHAIARAYPDLLPVADAPAILERVASDRARGRMPFIAPRILGS